MVTVTGLAVAVVSLARHLQGKDPSLASFLSASKESAARAGVSDVDLAFIATIIDSLSTQDPRAPKGEPTSTGQGPDDDIGKPSSSKVGKPPAR